VFGNEAIPIKAAAAGSAEMCKIALSRNERACLNAASVFVLQSGAFSCALLRARARTFPPYCDMRVQSWTIESRARKLKAAQGCMLG